MSGTQDNSGDTPITGGVISRVSSWASTPFLQQVDVGTVALCLVLAVCAAIIWTRVLRSVVKDVVGEVV